MRMAGVSSRRSAVAAIGLGCILGSVTIDIASRAFVVGPNQVPTRLRTAGTAAAPIVVEQPVVEQVAASSTAWTRSDRVMLGGVITTMLAASHVRGALSSSTARAARGGEEVSLTNLAKDFAIESAPDWQEGITALAITICRVIVALLVIHHGTEHTAEGSFLPGSNPAAVAGFAKNVVAPYMGWLPFLDSEGWTVVRDYTEVVCGGLMVIGLFTRPAAIGMFVTMLLANYFHIAKTGWQDFPFGHVPAHTYEFELSLANMVVFLMFAVAGAGPISVDNFVSKALKGR